MTDILTVAINGQVALLTLNRPGKLNALSNELLAAIIAALDGIELDPAVRAVVITGDRARVQRRCGHRRLSAAPGGRSGRGGRALHATGPPDDPARGVVP